jgi:hypothetical protein
MWNRRLIAGFGQSAIIVVVVRLVIGWSICQCSLERTFSFIERLKNPNCER